MKKIGPALLVAAAFIGPGTVTTASLAGANFGYALVWALLFSVLATYVLQEMASRLGLVSGSGLAEALRVSLPSGPVRVAAMLLVISAIGLGNAAYQGGNLTGAALALQTLTDISLPYWAWGLALLAASLLYSGKYKLLERSLMVLVALMSLVFVTTMLLAKPDWSGLLEGAFSFNFPDEASLSIIALIGTTVVPYNLFLHASIVAAQRDNSLSMNRQISNNRWDSALSIGLGGLVTLAILSCAASAFFTHQQSIDAANIALQLRPLLGDYAHNFFALGLFSAGLTSAITAPLAAAYAVSGALGWPSKLTDNRFRLIWALVLVSGLVFSTIGIQPLAAIVFAQATNGLLLPVVAIFLLWVMNQAALLGQYRNSRLANLLGLLIILLVSALGLYKLISLFT